jgi:nucleoside-diphosphate-sugar epimerase
MRIVITGATGHIGTYLVPRLVEAGHEVIALQRGTRQPYLSNKAWEAVQVVQVDRDQEDAAGVFGARVRELRPDAFLDLICFTPESARMIVEALRGQVQHYIHCGTIWVHGPSVSPPTTEEQPRRPFGSYGIMKAEIEAFLLEQARRHGFPATVLHPGHIVGQGWVPLNPQGHFDPEPFRRLACGDELALPNLGMETVHHVHADDVAQAFMQALANRSCALGESFHVVSPAALTLRGYAEAVAAWFGQPARLRYVPWEEWRVGVPEKEAVFTWDHIAHSPNCSIRKAERLLDYRSRYSSLQAVRESLDYLLEHGLLQF